MILMLSVRLAATVHAYLDAYAPTNILIRTLRTPPGQRFALPVAAVMTVGHGLLGAWLTSIIDSGGPGWLNPLALLCAWNTIKFAWVATAQFVSKLCIQLSTDVGRSRRVSSRVSQREDTLRM